MKEATPDSRRVYFLVYLALLMLLGATVAIAYIELGSLNTLLALAIAITKAVLVILYFMHVRESDVLTRIFVAAGFVWLLILIGLTLSDYLTRGWVSILLPLA